MSRAAEAEPSGREGSRSASSNPAEEPPRSDEAAEQQGSRQRALRADVRHRPDAPRGSTLAVLSVEPRVPDERDRNFIPGRRMRA